MGTQHQIIVWYVFSSDQTWGELIVNANALIMHSFFPEIQGND